MSNHIITTKQDHPQKKQQQPKAIRNTRKCKIKQLISEIRKLKTKEIGDEFVSSGDIQGANIQTIPTPPPKFSSPKHRLIPKDNVISRRQNPKKLLGLPLPKTEALQN